MVKRLNIGQSAAKFLENLKIIFYLCANLNTYKYDTKNYKPN